MKHNHNAAGRSFDLAALFALALRLVTGWTYFSAFWRRLILTNKLDPEVKGYIGEKFNHFLPNALFIKPGIEYLVSHEQALWWSMVIFTIVEGLVGLAFMLGLFTRLMSIGIFTLAFGILLGAGWLGTTCLDEWQIGVLGLAAGFTVLLSGGGYYSLDYRIGMRTMSARSKRIFARIGSGELNLSYPALKGIALLGTIFIVSTTLFTNQYFHGGLWGRLQNLSVHPHIVISDTHLDNNTLAFTVFRDQGADVYGSFLIAVRLKNEAGLVVMQKEAQELAGMNQKQIQNSYVSKVKAGKYSLVIPLGARARLQFADTSLSQLAPGNYQVELTDISGTQWVQTVVK